MQTCEDAFMARYIVAAIDDLFFSSKIRATAEAVGVEVTFARNAQAAIGAARKRRPDLFIVNLQADYAIDLGKLQHDEFSEVPLVGFYSHVMTELPHQAREAGYNYVMPRSAFSARLPEILNGNF